jgi:hypothetical protein
MRDEDLNILHFYDSFTQTHTHTLPRICLDEDSNADYFFLFPRSRRRCRQEKKKSFGIL